MKKVFVLVLCLAVVLILNKVSVAQEDEDASVPEQPQFLSVEKIVGEVQPDGATIWRPASPQALPFGYLPYPTVDGLPAYGVPYSYPRAPRRFGNRFAPPPPQPHPLPTPGAVPGATQPQAPPMVAPPLVMGQMPQRQGVLGLGQPAQQPGQPVVVQRPTPFRNFLTLMSAPRPYIGYDPYAGYPDPSAGYLPIPGQGTPHSPWQ